MTHPRSTTVWIGIALCLILLAPAGPAAAGLLPTFSKAFLPTDIGPGSTATLRFDIGNPDPDNPVSDLAFVDNLPASVVIADPANASTDCEGAILSAPAGASTISFTDGGLGSDSTCSVFVDVSSAVVGTHMNVSSDLTHSAGSSPPAMADLIVDDQLPGFTKAFDPSSAVLGATSTLTITIDNSLINSDLWLVSFTDNLPPGLFVATPANASTDCAALGPPTLTAVSGSGTISLVNGSVSGNSTCTVSVDVAAESAGLKGNTTGELSVSLFPSFDVLSPGKASATLEVTRPFLRKLFTDDPTPAGSTVTLEFTIVNFDRADSATDISFTDDLDAALSGLEGPGFVLIEPCGVNSELSGTGVLTFTGGSLAPEASCTFSLPLNVPAEAAAGSYVNTTSSVTFSRGGDQVVEDPASDDLIVAPVPTFTKSFVDDPVTPGDTVTLRFDITNTSSSFEASGLTFFDMLPEQLPTAFSTPGADPCGAGSSVNFTPLIDADTTILARIELLDGVLAAGASCSFDVVLDVEPTSSSGVYPNVTSPLAATIDGTALTANPATDDLVIVAAPRLVKEFTDDPALAGGTVTLQFTLDLPEEAPAGATDIEFTDDLDAVLSGLEAVGLPMNDVCGAGSQVSGTGLLSFTGGIVTPGSSCSFSVTLQMPAEAMPGELTNTTSTVSAMSMGIPVSSNAASAPLLVGGLTFTKEFTDDPVVAGGTVTLEFKIDNLSASSSATGMIFTDNLDAALDGLTALGLPINDPCGAGSSLTGAAADTFLIFQDGLLPALTSCTFPVSLQVPGNADASDYLNTTSLLTGSVGGSAVVIPAASDSLSVIEPLSLQKLFVDDPVPPGNAVTLEFTLTNTATTGGVTGISFTDDLDGILTGLAAFGLPADDVCGAGSQITGTGFLSFTGGSLGADESCTFQVNVFVPVNAPLGTVTNVTSEATGTFDALATTAAPASDDLTVAEAVCTAPDGENATLANDSLFDLLSVTVCEVIEVGPDYVVGPGGFLTLRAGDAVLFLNGVSFDASSQLSVGIDPDLKP